jgi:peptidoglycan/LPS O-acetylase OafA/YrhL
MQAPMQTNRRYDLDWLKALAVILVPIIHGGIIFSDTPYLIKNDETSLIITAVVILIGMPLMPLFFMISGMSIYFALGSKKLIEFVRSRIVRLIVPFVFGLFAISSVSTYFAVRRHGDFSGSFLEFYAHYFDGWWGYGGIFPWYGHHLYFLLYLFVFSLLGLGPFLLLRGDRGQRWLAALASFVNKPGGLYVLILPIAAIEYFNPLINLGVPHQGGWHMFSFVFFLIYGFFFANNDGFQHAIERHARYAPWIALLSVIAAALLYLISPNLYLSLIPVSIYVWSIDILILTYARKHLSQPSKTLALLGDSALPFYIVHEPILVAIAFYVCAKELAILPKLAIILTASLPLMVLAVALIRRVNGLRFLFGLRPVAKDWRTEQT